MKPVGFFTWDSVCDYLREVKRCLFPFMNMTEGTAVLEAHCSCAMFQGLEGIPHSREDAALDLILRLENLPHNLPEFHLGEVCFPEASHWDAGSLVTCSHFLALRDICLCDTRSPETEGARRRPCNCLSSPASLCYFHCSYSEICSVFLCISDTFPPLISTPTRERFLKIQIIVDCSNSGQQLRRWQ